mgnify:CR=1 FL=1
MSTTARRLWVALRAVRQLGVRQAAWYALYQGGLRAGLWRRLTPPAHPHALPLPIQSPFPLPNAAQIKAAAGESISDFLKEADEIVSGQARLFGGPPVELQLAPPAPLRHWTEYELGRAPWGAEDVKFVWEPARFGWVYPLGRAYLLTGSPTYAAAFWQYFRHFSNTNPPNLGPNWASGQEVALRLLALLFAARVFAGSPENTSGNLALLAGAVALHAGRIPPTLSYARAQHNNHLISEALALYLAGTALPNYRRAAYWRALGWRTLCQALESQIALDGTYAQHSVNYHRLMLQAALLGTLPNRPYPLPVRQKLAAATHWLLAQLDPDSGQTPNYGSNDGAYIFPLAPGGISDYRPVAQAAACAFLGQPALPPGPWDEMLMWLGSEKPPTAVLPPLPPAPAIHRLGRPGDWAVLRAIRYTSRPSQADQLHLDLWYRGYNIALDAGTYRYSAPAPWENALSRTAPHNTVEVDNQDQMSRAGRFLWLDWAQAAAWEEDGVLAACHDGYQRLGVRHCRRVHHLGRGQWLIEDHLQAAASAGSHRFRLHWLLPDWPWKLTGHTLSLSAPWGGLVNITLSVAAPPGLTAQLSLTRAGQALAGAPTADPTLGWVAPTYACKLPALAFVLQVEAPPPLTLHSRWDVS